jgi:hypothetical protein
MPVGPDHKVQVYKLESVEISGTTRLSSEKLATELGLVPGTPLDDSLVMSARTRLLGLGLFKSAILIMRKGSKPGYARLVVEVEDDQTVLTDWALGGELGVTIDQSTAQGADPNQAPMDYLLQLVGRNLFTDLHRGAVMIDIDAHGDLRAGQLAYGLPRFAREDAQFDAELAVVDPRYRYLDALAFGGRGQGLWSRSVAGVGEVQYGAAMYVNKGPDFIVPGFPDAVAGPKLAYYKETRLRGFFPGEGHQIGASLLLSPTQTENSVLELDLAKTVACGDWLYATVEGKALAVGSDGYSFRAESRLDLPFGMAQPGEDQAEAFIRLRGGKDSVGDVSLVGSDLLVGVRYHSSGFIAELALKVTRSPQELTTARPVAPGGTP